MVRGNELNDAWMVHWLGRTQSASGKTSLANEMLATIKLLLSQISEIVRQ